MTTIDISQYACPTGSGVAGDSSKNAPASANACSSAPGACAGAARVSARPSLGDCADLTGLLTLAQLGDEDAFAQLYRHTSSVLFGVILRVTHHRAEAEDILQDVYMALWQRRLVFDAQRGDVLAWMSTIARNRAISYLRKRQPIPLDETLMSSIAADTALPPELSEKDREKRRLSVAMTALSAQQRQAITIAYFGGFTYTELARTLGVPEGTAKSWIRRGLAKLRDVLES
ncbi:RNA polymerase subunit sigma-24 [Pandoraea cepalis]|uniref:RNA polymerase subunit sigma-24 n=1 Tax=Pandoraea cepalis TaxID=2508294 RepID=A0AAW7MG90_9BURK|nr:sigma-70 family RNA polymerase sigma factor [Pandoraea cepalis]MDN4571779.1 RNA polymerase subunit sigma-24 [Pandoraea cepalis]MDN4576620.1 RNA polymerase subunit sigma-24 [Pandoraea cepalis]